MNLTKIIIITTLILSASSDAPKLSPHNYPAWFEYAIQPLAMKNQEEAVTPFITALEGKNKKSSSKTAKKESESSKKKKTEKKKEVKDAVLFEMEGGRVASIVGNLDLSQQLFGSCIEKFKESEMAPVISVSKGATKAASVVAGESIGSYQVMPYEKIMVYIQQAMNYLAQNNLESSMVEVRNANTEQKNALEKYKKELEKVHKDAEEVKDIDYNNIIDSNYAGLDEIIGKAKNSFQNAFSFYMCGIISECYALRGGGSGMDLNDAYISYKDALEICPDNPYLQKDVLRLAKILGMETDYKELSNRFPDRAKELENSNINPDAGNLVVIYEYELVPKLAQLDIPIPTPNGVLSLSLPTYPSESKIDEQPLNISIDNSSISGETDVLCNIASMAAKNLKEKLPGILIREIIRTTAMGVAQHEASKRAGILGSLAVTVIDEGISRCDLRSYYSLPYYISCYRNNLDPGKHHISCSAPNLKEEISIDLDIQPKSFTILRIVEVKGSLYHKVIQI